jgi:hypothetical protein
MSSASGGKGGARVPRGQDLGDEAVSGTRVGGQVEGLAAESVTIPGRRRWPSGRRASPSIPPSWFGDGLPTLASPGFWVAVGLYGPALLAPILLARSRHCLGKPPFLMDP